MFGGDDAADGGLAVELAEPCLLWGLLAPVSVLGGEIQARHVAPEFRFGLRHHQRAAGSGAGQHGGVRGGVEAGGFQGVGGGVRGRQLGDQAGFRQCREQRLEHIPDVFRGGEGIEGREHLLHPLLIPRLGAAPMPNERFQTPLAGRADGGEHRQRRTPPEVLQRRVAAERGVGIAALGNVDDDAFGQAFEAASRRLREHFELFGELPSETARRCCSARNGAHFYTVASVAN